MRERIAATMEHACMTETTTETTARGREIEGLRRASDLLCLWRVCGNAVCRRARSCRGRARLCARRNGSAVPPPVREFFLSFLAATSVGVDFEAFREEMEGRDETDAFFAWREACSAR
jgi:hypothetical protein